MAAAVFAPEIENLTGMFAVQYHPYEEGNGTVHWVKNPAGHDTPVVTAKRVIWANLSTNAADSPARIARLFNHDASGERLLLAWTTVHTWSGFKRMEDDEHFENGQSGAEGTVTPTRWCVERLDPSIQVVSPEGLLWRVQLRDRLDQTRAIIEGLR